ncbi:indole-3-glycerol phosphate synthase TrpC [Convivina praedatoris]|uniref:Indole-3-glycerol phosphate synthase n=1 Tax=Convivina praedatoris TaxID=2880963 RepID=A0ABN8H954_9LACO|nr:indole-3-glycerol phosphate synthase TrpC [Convivina sp. LMG 32447]CAH1851862.1 Indole-3-glycerol phosphate synthase [Convivina sp. LMG 32447]CAH1853935.1 Indole-3-glycerol phosphate synthase [Convivina sp. LMG 32447]CAH1854115.1 Indole-3-glycerol phosphate synthase [Convivina sp. LMG 32447]
MILDDLVAATKKNMARRQDQVSLVDLKAQIEKAANQLPEFVLNQKLAQAPITVIAEIKQASPSKGQIVPSEAFDYQQIARDYTQAKVDMISVLTEEDYFKGSLDILKAVVATTNVPILRKDFTIDPYMIYEAKAAGASAILLIVAILSDQQLTDYLALAQELGLSAIVEAHDQDEIKRAVQAGAEIIGVNNRNLKDFTVDFGNTQRLRENIPANIAVISESGIQSRSDVLQLEQAGINGILVGETFMKAPDKVAEINHLRGFSHDQD